MTGLMTHIKHNAIAWLALFVALGGSGYAAVGVSAGSVGTRQLKNHSITPVKFARDSIAGYVRDWAQVDTAGQVRASRPRAHLVGWTDQPGTPFPGGLVSWGRAIPAGCFAIATTASFTPGGSSASAEVVGAGSGNGPEVGVKVLLSAPQTAVNVALLCPQP